MYVYIYIYILVYVILSDYDVQMQANNGWPWTMSKRIPIDRQVLSLMRNTSE